MNMTGRSLAVANLAKPPAYGRHHGKKQLTLDIFHIKGGGGSFWELLFSHIWAFFWTIYWGGGVVEPIPKVLG